MPSKSKKSSRIPSKLSQSDHDSNTLSLPAVSVSSPFNLSPYSLERTQEELLFSLDEASRKFPSFIAQTAFIGRILENPNDASTDRKGCKIWLSESAMISSSISPGFTVSVSLAPLEKVPSGFPLSSLSNESAKHFESDFAENFVDEAGNYFALATVFPSSKVLKNGVRLSSNLLCTMGYPVSGRIIFVYPVKCQPLTDNGGTSYGHAASYLSLDICKELHLSFISVKCKFTNESAISRYLNLDRGNRISSPETSSLSKVDLSSPSSTHDKSTSEKPYLDHKSVNIPGMEEVLWDDNAKKLLQTCIASWLNSRILLRGNFVIVPILSRLCIFQVVGFIRFSANNEIQYLLNNTNCIPSPRTPFTKDGNCAFLIEQGTKIYLPSPGNPKAEVSKEFPHLELGHGCTKDNLAVNFTKLGGLFKEFAVLKQIIIDSAVTGAGARWGMQPIKGVLIHGPSGTGKTSLVRLCAHDAGVNLFTVNGPEIIREYDGASEQALHEIFGTASQAAPAVYSINFATEHLACVRVFIDDLDAIAPENKDGDEHSKSMVATLSTLMDGISKTDGLLVIAATNRLESIDPALRWHRRLGREIEIGVPSPEQRHEILLALLSKLTHSLTDKDVEHLAKTTHGFVGADLASLCNEATSIHLWKHVDMEGPCGYLDCEPSTSAYDTDCPASTHSCNGSGGDMDASLNLKNTPKCNLATAFSSLSEMQNSSAILPQIKVNVTCDLENNLRVTFEDFETARIRVKPSAMREVIFEVPKVSWEDVGGQSEVKKQLKEVVEWPQMDKDAIGTRIPKGILLFGPPGCSKTLLARAVASEARLNFLAVKGPELFSKWVGESQKAIRSLFAKAKANAPSVIFFDEIDGLASIRGKDGDEAQVGDHVITQLLTELNGLHERVNVTVIAATNRIDKIDPALLRPGRFDRRIYVRPPNEKDREDIFRVHLHQKPCSSDVCTKELSRLTEGCTGADISLICHEAAIAAIEEDPFVSEITMNHLKTGIRRVPPSEVQLDEQMLIKFQRLVVSTSDEDNSGSRPCSR